MDAVEPSTEMKPAMAAVESSRAALESLVPTADSCPALMLHLRVTMAGYVTSWESAATPTEACRRYATVRVSVSVSVSVSADTTCGASKGLPPPSRCACRGIQKKTASQARRSFPKN
jgi:hypothetical protein